MTRDEAQRLANIVRDQIEEDGADPSSAALRQIGNGEHVVILSNEQCAWFLWSHRDYHDLRKRDKKTAKQQRKSEQQQARRKKQREEVSA